MSAARAIRQDPEACDVWWTYAPRWASAMSAISLRSSLFPWNALPYAAMSDTWPV